MLGCSDGGVEIASSLSFVSSRVPDDSLLDLIDVEASTVSSTGAPGPGSFGAPAGPSNGDVAGVRGITDIRGGGGSRHSGSLLGVENPTGSAGVETAGQVATPSGSGTGGVVSMESGGRRGGGGGVSVGGVLISSVILSIERISLDEQ